MPVDFQQLAEGVIAIAFAAQVQVVLALQAISSIPFEPVMFAVLVGQRHQAGEQVVTQAYAAAQRIALLGQLAVAIIVVEGLVPQRVDIGRQQAGNGVAVAVSPPIGLDLLDHPP